MPPEPPSPELRQAWVDFIEALISRNHSAAHAAHAVIARYARPEPPLSAAEQAKRDQRTKFVVKWVCALRERREEETRGVVRPPLTPEQLDEAKPVMDRLRRWFAGDDSAGPFEWS